VIITDQNIPDDPTELRQFATQMLTGFTDLEDKHASLEARHKAEIQNRDMMITKLRHQLFGLRKDKFGSSGEGLDQLGLKLEDEETGQEHDAAASDVSVVDEAPAKVKPVRRALPEHLPRTDVRFTPDAPCAGCGADLDDSAKTFGEDVMEELEYVPGRFVVNCIIRPRLSCAACETISQASMPSRPIPKSYAGPGLLASIIVGKYADHLPLYRQSQIMAREGIDIDRSTLAGWVGRSAHLLERLSDMIRDHVMASSALFADDTTIKLLAPGNGKTKTARLWIYSRDERAWSGTSPQAAWYQFSPDRKGKRTEAHLAGYKGFIHADGYAGFNKLYDHDKATEMACMAHIRRKFVDIFEAQGSAIAGETIKRIATLYAIEKQVRGCPPDERVFMRQQHSKPILETLEHWLSKQLTHISGKSPLAGAIRYALTRIPKVRPYLDHGFLELDNNTAERAMRPIAIGRKNYLFLGSEKGGKSAAICYSLIETCKLNNINPQSWLTYALANIQDTKVSDLDRLMPWNYVEES
jgi:transposase